MKTRELALAALFAAFTAVGAFIKIPLGISHITLQVFFTLMAGMLLGPRYGALSQAVYVLLGLVGFPVFTMGGGLSYVFQPTFGFLLGLLPMAYIAGAVAQRREGRRQLLLAAVLGILAMYAVGVPYLYVISNFYLGRAMDLGAALWFGMLIYLPGEAVKIAALLLAVPPIRRSIRALR